MSTRADPVAAEPAAESASERVVVERKVLTVRDMSVVLAAEDVRRLTDWSFENPHHTLVVHLAGHLQRMESTFSRGPSSASLPSLGDVWAIPAGSRYSALARGSQVRFAEFHIPVALLGGGDLAPQMGRRDRFLHEATARAAELSARDDDLAGMALAALLEAIRCHLAVAFLGARREVEPVAGRQRFSDAQKQRLVDFVMASMHESIDVQGLASVAGVTAPRLVAAFKSSFGTTPWQFVLRMRLREACRLLESRELSITSVSELTGFSSPSHLATSFRKHFGISPADYRRDASGRSHSDS